jgi:hypothetical protein
VIIDLRGNGGRLLARTRHQRAVHSHGPVNARDSGAGRRAGGYDPSVAAGNVVVMVIASAHRPPNSAAACPGLRPRRGGGTGPRTQRAPCKRWSNRPAAGVAAEDSLGVFKLTIEQYFRGRRLGAVEGVNPDVVLLTIPPRTSNPANAVLRSLTSVAALPYTRQLRVDHRAARRPQPGA